MVFRLAMSWALAGVLAAQEWPVYGGDAAGTKYSPLDQINRTNVAHLKPAWTFHTGELRQGRKDPKRFAFETTPLAVDGTLYLTSSFSRLIALEADTGKRLWTFDPKINADRFRQTLVNRGAAFWTDGRRKQIFLATLDGRLFSIDASTGEMDRGFGKGGWLDLRDGVADRYPGKPYGMTSPPAVYKDLVICGSMVSHREPRGPAGDVRAFDARTGRLVWSLHTVPRGGEFGSSTWEGESWKNRTGAEARAGFSVDVERGIVYVPLASPAADFWGSDRKGPGLFSDSLVALHAATGERLWHFQTVHHDIWGYGLPAAPTLVTVKRSGAAVAAVAVVTKTGFTFVFDRVTGASLFDIQERPAPPSQIPGEQAAATQPFPVKPPSFARQSFRPDELTNFTPESRAYCAKLLEKAVLGNVYTPVGPKPTVLFPGANGGASWGGASFDPETRTLYVNSTDVGMLVRLIRQAEGSEVSFRPRGSGTVGSRFWDAELYPCQKPPWGWLTAIDLDTGEFRWRSVLGGGDISAQGGTQTGAPNFGGSIVTAGGLIFIGATSDRRFRAFDKDTGKELWAAELPASAHATPMTFVGKKTRKQFVVIAAGGDNEHEDDISDALVAFSLPAGQ